MEDEEFFGPARSLRTSHGVRNVHVGKTWPPEIFQEL